jgi:hypothetical protein
MEQLTVLRGAVIPSDDPATNEVYESSKSKANAAT